MLKKYSGSCHCGAVRFEVDLDISAGTTKCNCSICVKMRLWSSQAPPEAFHLLAGDSELTDYQGCNQVAHHVFCRHCGVRSFEWVDVPNMSGHKYFSINLLSLDGVNVDELVAAPVSYPDGRNNDWGSQAFETRHL
jgi:hypothetical protein